MSRIHHSRQHTRAHAVRPTTAHSAIVPNAILISVAVSVLIGIVVLWRIAPPQQVKSVISENLSGQPAALAVDGSTPTTTAPTALPTRTSPTTTLIAATGDVMISRRVLIEAQARGYTWPFTEVREILGGADISLINLENPVMVDCPYSRSEMVFCMPAAALEGLTDAGIDLATVANNHTLDHGIEGYYATLDALSAVGIVPSSSEALVTVDRGETQFGFLSFNRIAQRVGMSILPVPEVLARIEAAAGQVDALIVSFHWGVEFTTDPTVEQRDLAHAAVDAGADAIIGHHPHILQPLEVYRDVPIFYSLGNFVFDNMTAAGPRTGWIALLEFEGDRLMGYETITTVIYDFGQPRVQAASETP